MKFEVDRDVLLDPLVAVQGVVERRQTLPILANVHISISDGTLAVTATSIRVTFSSNQCITYRVSTVPSGPPPNPVIGPGSGCTDNDTVVIAGLTPSTDYIVNVVVTNAAGQSTSAQANATTLAET